MALPWTASAGLIVSTVAQPVPESGLKARADMRIANSRPGSRRGLELDYLVLVSVVHPRVGNFALSRALN